MSEGQSAAIEQTLDRYARFLRRAREMGVVGHRGGLKATRDLLEMCDLKPGQRILEVGCGSGYTACTAAKESGASIIATDFETHLLERARQRARSMKIVDSIALTRVDARRLPFPDSAFDGIICESVLAFLPDREAAIEEFHRVLKPGGFLANNEVTFLKPPPEDFLAAIRSAGPRSRGALIVPVDVEEHTHLLALHGLTTVRVETGDVPTRQQTLEQLQVDGLRALKPVLASIFDREMRQSVHRREMAEVQRTFEEHTGYGLYFARKAD